MNKTLAPNCRQSPLSEVWRRPSNAVALAVAFAFSAVPTARASVLDIQQLTIAPNDVLNLTPNFVIDTQTLTIAPGGVLNITNNSVLVRNDDFAKIYAYVVVGYNGGAWNGQSSTAGSINSSTAANDPNDCTAVGIINNAEAGYASFEGIATPAGTETFIKYTYYGDANLDGTVDLVDFGLIGGGTGWFHGDFNYSGTIDAEDITLFNKGLACVPEPGSLTLLAAGVMSLLCRRRNKKY